MRRVEAAILDVGGVLLLPDSEILAAALSAADIDHEASALDLAHYHGVAALDTEPATWPGPGAPAAYLEGLVAAAGVPAAQQARARRVLHERVFTRPSDEVWRQCTPWADAGLAALAAAALPVAVVSNSDGTVEAQLRALRLAQLGPGPGLEVVAIVDSGRLGVAKPDPAVFTPALDVLDVEPAACLYVGDTVTYDVHGAHAAGLQVVHLDPLGACGRRDHPHARDLPDAVPSP